VEDNVSTCDTTEDIIVFGKVAPDDFYFVSERRKFFFVLCARASQDTQVIFLWVAENLGHTRVAHGACGTGEEDGFHFIIVLSAAEPLF
jgi:hypothetical protein